MEFCVQGSDNWRLSGNPPRLYLQKEYQKGKERNATKFMVETLMKREITSWSNNRKRLNNEFDSVFWNQNEEEDICKSESYQ